MKELIEKMKKYSAVQLIEKLEKGKVDENEKSAIISELRRKGRDVTPYVGEATTEEGELVNKPADLKVSVSEKLKKEKEEKKQSLLDSPGTKAASKRVRINFQSEDFPKGSIVKIQGATTLADDETEAVVKSAFFWEGKPENWYVVLAPVGGGKTFSKSYKGVTLVLLATESETAEVPTTEGVKAV
jgi:hypothetical protein